MKMKAKSLLIIAVFTLLLISLTTFSYATTNLQVSDINVTVTKAKAEITWSKVTNADGYDVYVDFPEVGYQFVGTVSNNSVQIIGFEEDEIYAVKVKAYKYENGKTTYSDFSPEVQFKLGEDSQITTQVGNVTGIKATVASNGTYGTVEWNEANNATGYEVYASINNNSFTNIGDVKDNKITVIGIKENQVYKIKIKPYMEVNGQRIYGSFSDTVILKYEKENEPVVKPSQVTGLNVSMDGENAKLTWNKVSNVDGYEIQIKLTGKVDATYETGNTNITLNGFTEGYTYVARVRAYKYVNGEKVYGEYSSSKNIKYEPEVEIDRVTGLDVEVDGSYVRFEWDRVRNADGYEIDITTPDGIIRTYTTGNTYKNLGGFTDTDGRYSVQVRAYEYVNGKKVYGDYSTRKYFESEYTELDKVTGLDIEIDGSNVRFDWNRVRNADGYEINIRTPDGTTKTYTTTNTYKNLGGFTDTSGDYSVRVRAYRYANGKKVYGDYSSRQYFESEYANLNKVTGLKVEVDGSKAEFSWNRVKGADGYEIVINIPGYGDCTYNETSTSRYMTGFTNTTDRYSIKVRAYKYVNGKKVYGEYSTKKYFRGEQEEVDTVTGLVVKRSGDAAKFSWNKVTGADGYEIVVYIPGIGDCTYNETATSRYMTGFTETKYKYTVKVRAYEYMDGKKVYGDYTREISF